MATGYFDNDGFWHYGEDDLADEGAGFSEVLNKSTNAIPAAVRARVVAELNSDPTIRAAVIAGVDAAADEYDFAANLGVETVPVPEVPTGARLIFAFEDDSYPVIIKEDGTMFAREFETRTDLAEGTARVIFAYEDDSVAGVINDDGTGLGGEAKSMFPAVARGSSLTAGADIPDPAVNRWQTLLSALIGKSIDNSGLSGSMVEEIGFHAGAHSVTATSDVAFPSAGAIALAAASFDVDPWRAGSNAAVQTADVVAVTPAGLVMSGTLARTSGTVRTFTRTDGGPAAPAGKVTFRARPTGQPGQLLILDTIANNTDETVAGLQTLAQLKAWTREITTHHDGPVALWGLLDRGLPEAPGTDVGNLILAYEEWCATEYGNAWYPVRRYLASEQALTDALIFDPAFVPTALDHQTVAAGAVPPSFRASENSIHQSLIAHKLQALYIAREFALRGVTHA